jgi:polyisoprenyl-teichoic acid--peptidoglycan teichoic acid transferase
MSAALKWLLTFAWAVFVLGGLAAGWAGFYNFALLARPAPGRVAGAPSGTQVALAAHPPLRDFDESPPPFEPAGAPTPQAAQPTPQPSSPAGRMTILLMGIDQRPDEVGPGGDPGRSDTMLLVSIDYDARTAVMVSVPRDGFVVIPGHGNERVNAAYTFGEIDKRGSGTALAMKTVAQIFGVPVDRYGLVDIHSMETIIDTLGGIWIDNPYRLIDREYPTDDYRTMTIDIPAGRQLMDGVTAVRYARTRHPDSDYGRQTRQQQVLRAIRDRALQFEVVPRLPQLIPQMMDLVHTNLNPVELAELVNFGRGLDGSKDLISLTPDPKLTPSYTGPGGASYINLTPAYRASVRAMIQFPRVAAERAEIEVYNAGAPAGAGGRVADLLDNAGLVVGQISTASTRVTSTRIETGAAARQSAEMIARTLSLSTEALVVTDDSRAIRVLLGPDLLLATG